LINGADFQLFNLNKAGKKQTAGPLKPAVHSEQEFNYEVPVSFFKSVLSGDSLTGYRVFISISWAPLLAETTMILTRFLQIYDERQKNTLFNL